MEENNEQLENVEEISVEGKKKAKEMSERDDR